MRSPFGRARRAVNDRLAAPRAIERVASLGPLPPAPTGIATYHRAVLDGLERIGFTRRLPVDPVWPVRDADFATVPAYRLGVYHLGNNADFHLPIYRMVWQAPGLIVLHDLSLDDFVRGLHDERRPARVRRDARGARGPRGHVAAGGAREPAAPDPVDRRRRPACERDRGARRVLPPVPGGPRLPHAVFVVPHPPVESAAAIAGAAPAGAEAARDARGARRPHAGGRPRRYQRGQAARRAARRRRHVCPTTCTWPSSVAASRRTTSRPVAQGSGLGRRLHVETDVTDAAFLAWLAAADIVVDLRHPHRGEVSGSLARAMQVGRPTIVSATGTYLDSPEGTVVTVASGETDPVELAARIAELAGDDERRERMGATARAYMADLAAREATAHGYAEAIEATMRVVDDPVGVNMRRWADALADLGVTETELADGYGLGFARALESFTHPS